MKTYLIYLTNRATQWIIDTVFVFGVIGIAVFLSGIKITFDPADLISAELFLKSKVAQQVAQAKPTAAK